MLEGQEFKKYVAVICEPETQYSDVFLSGEMDVRYLSEDFTFRDVSVGNETVTL